MDTFMETPLDGSGGEGKANEVAAPLPLFSVCCPLANVDESCRVSSARTSLSGALWRLFALDLEPCGMR